MYAMLEAAPPQSAMDAQRDPVLHTLLAQLPVGVVIATRNGDLELVNDVARTLFADHRRPNPPEPWLVCDGHVDDGLHPIHWVIARILLTGELIRDEEIELLDCRNEWRTLSVSGTPLQDASGKITSALVTFVDVTASRRAKEWE